MEIGQSLRGGDAPKPFFVCELPAAIRSALWDLLAEAAQRRPLTRTETKLRCAIRPTPWRDLGCDRSTFYRRRKRALQRAREEVEHHVPPARESRDGKSYSIRQAPS